jgi:hypothetical protein
MENEQATEQVKASAPVGQGQRAFSPELLQAAVQREERGRAMKLEQAMELHRVVSPELLQAADSERERAERVRLLMVMRTEWGQASQQVPFSAQQPPLRVCTDDKTGSKV